MPATQALHPGKILKERFLDPLGITPYRLAKAIGVHVRRVSELVHGRRALSPDTAQRLALYFDVPAVWFLRMQAEFDAASADNLDELKAVVQPHDSLADVLITPTGVTRLSDGPSATPTISMASAPADFVQRLREQARSRPQRRLRDTRVVHYDNGATALIGDSQ